MFPKQDRGPFQGSGSTRIPGKMVLEPVSAATRVATRRCSETGIQIDCYWGIVRGSFRPFADNAPGVRLPAPCFEQSTPCYCQMHRYSYTRGDEGTPYNQGAAPRLRSSRS